MSTPKSVEIADARQRATLELENALIIQINTVAHALSLLTKALTVGYMDTTINGARMDLGAAQKRIGIAQDRYADVTAKINQEERENERLISGGRA